jgi:hypothetical protein
MLYEMLVFCIVSGAITYVATESVLWAPVRIVFGVLLDHALARHPILRIKCITFMYCPMCFGFWVGVICNALGWGPWAPGPRGVFEAGCAGLLMGAVLTNLISFNAYNKEVGDKGEFDDSSEARTPD